MSDFRWKTTEDATFYLQLAQLDGVTPLTGSSPTVSVRRHSDLGGNLLDNFFYDNSGSFSASADFHTMTEVDSTNSPGLYAYQFGQSSIAIPTIYNVYFSSSSGFAVESHLFEDANIQIFSGNVALYESEPDPVR